MHDLTSRQQKIQEKRKLTPFRDCVREIASWRPLNIYNLKGTLSRYPDTPRKGNIVNNPLAIYTNTHTAEYTGNFFADFWKLYHISEKTTLLQSYENENAKYNDASYGLKDCYLTFSCGLGVEHSLYSIFCRGNCDSIVNSWEIFYNSSVIFESKNIRQSAFIFYCANIDNSSDLRFCRDMIGCHHCIDCNTLLNKSYYINNVSYSKEAYEQKKTELLKQKSSFSTIKQEVFAKMGNLNTNNSTWAGIINSDNIENGYVVNNTHIARNAVLVGWGNGYESQEIYDGIYTMDSKYMYASLATGRSEYWYCGIRWWLCSNCFYSIDLDNCSFCLGCMGLQNKQFCIFNKQYTKEDRYAKVDEIFTQMEKDWTLWQFFPATMNPFYFNDTAAYLIDPTFTQEEVEKAGYLRRSTPIKVDIPTDADLVKVSELDQYETFDENGNRTINPAILQKVIQDEAGNARRVVKMEYDFLMKYALPLPRKHRLERMKENFKIG